MKIILCLNKKTKKLDTHWVNNTSRNLNTTANKMFRSFRTETNYGDTTKLFNNNVDIIIPQKNLNKPDGNLTAPSGSTIKLVYCFSLSLSANLVQCMLKKNRKCKRSAKIYHMTLPNNSWFGWYGVKWAPNCRCDAISPTIQGQSCFLRRYISFFDCELHAATLRPPLCNATISNGLRRCIEQLKFSLLFLPIIVILIGTVWEFCIH